eukprot:31059_1
MSSSTSGIPFAFDGIKKISMKDQFIVFGYIRKCQNELFPNCIHYYNIPPLCTYIALKYYHSRHIGGPLCDHPRFEYIQTIWYRTYKSFHKGIDKQTNKFISIKQRRKNETDGHEGVNVNRMREISLLKKLKHKSIIEMTDFVWVNDVFHLIFEFIPYNLHKYIKNLGKGVYLNVKQLKTMTYNLIEGIRYCHSNRILHRNLNSSSITISQTGQLKIANFSFGREYNLQSYDLTPDVGHIYCRSPERLLGEQKYCAASDMWSIGCILFEMATKKILFKCASEIELLFTMYQLLGTPNDQIWPGVSGLPYYNSLYPKWNKQDSLFKLLKSNGKLDLVGIDLLNKLLLYAPNLRITAKKALEHKWFDEIRFEMINKFGFVYPHCGSKQFQLNKYNTDKQYFYSIDV